MYVDANGNLTDTVSEGTEPKAAYHDGMNFVPFYRWFSEAVSTRTDHRIDGTFNAFHIEYIDNTWYAVNGNHKVALKNELYDWNHFTIVMKIDNSVTYNDGTTGEYDPLRTADMQNYNFSKSEAYVYAMLLPHSYLSSEFYSLHDSGHYKIFCSEVLPA